MRRRGSIRERSRSWKKVRKGTIEPRDLATAERDADDRRRDGLGDRLQRVHVAALVVRVPVRMVVIELVHRGLVGTALSASERPALTTAYLAIVAFVALVDNRMPVANHEQPVDVSVHASGDVAIERVERRAGESL